MKTMNIYKSLAFLAVAFIFAACEEELDQTGTDNIEPNFPELVENYAVEPGSTQEIVFTPNLDWKVTIPTEIRQWFWIVDGTFKVTELNGGVSAEPVAVQIGVTENAEFDKNFSCEVTLHMGDTSKVVAKYMLPAKNKTLQVYAAVKEADGSFKLAEDGLSYVYASEEAQQLDLVWSETDADFRMPVKVVANCEWTVEVPEWAEVNLPESTAGILEFVITGESLDADSGMLVFKHGNDKLLELVASIPSCSGMEVYSAKLDEGEFVYDEEGEYQWTEKPVSEVNLAWLGTDFRMPVKVNSKCNWTLEFPEWLTAELPDKTSGVVSITLMGVPSKYPLENTKDKIVFKREGVDMYVVDVTIPGCKDIMYFNIDMSLTSLDYNNRGNKLRTSTGLFVQESATGRLIGVENVRMIAVETTGAKVGKENPEWFSWELSNWNKAKGADILQERTVTFDIKSNYVDNIEGEDRSAVLFVMPPSVNANTSEMMNDDASVKEDFVKWAIPITQKHYPFITIQESAKDFSFESASLDKKNALVSEFGETDYVYVLTYKHQYSSDNALMSISEPYDSFTVFSSVDKESSVPEKEDGDEDVFWLQFVGASDSNDAGTVHMYDGMQLPYDVSSVGYIVFYKNTANDGEEPKSEALAIIECVSPYVPKPDPVLEVNEENMIFTPESLIRTFTVTSNVEWTIECSEDWCQVTPLSGEGNDVVTVTLQEAQVPREAEIRVSSETLSRVIKVSQKVADVLEVDRQSVEFCYLASKKTVKIVSNVSWNVNVADSWCTVNESEGAGEKTLTFAVDRNRSILPRSTKVMISSESVFVELLITQRGNDGSQLKGLEDEYGNVFDVADSYLTSSVSGATVFKCTEGPYYDMYKEYENKEEEINAPDVLVLEYTSVDVIAELQLPQSAKQWFLYPSTYSQDITVNNKTYYTSSGMMSRAVDKVTIGMTKAVYDNREDIYKNNGLKIAFHKDITQTTPCLVVFCRLEL